MVTGELNPNKPNVVEYGPAPSGTTVDVSDQNEIDIELFGSAGDDGANGGRVIGRGYDVSSRSQITLVIADGASGELDGGAGGGDGGGLTVVKRGSTIDLAAHGGGGGGGDVGGGGGAAGGTGGNGTNSSGSDGQTSPAVANLGGDGDTTTTFAGAGAGGGEVVTSSQVNSSDTETGGGQSQHEGLVRIKFTPAATVSITDTNSPVKVGDEVVVDVDVTNEESSQSQITVELEVDPA